MNRQKDLIVELSKRIRQNKNEIQEKLRSLGRVISSMKSEFFQDTPLNEAHAGARKLDKDFADNRKKIKLISEAAARNGEIKELLKDIREQLETIERENETIYENIGQTAFTSFIEGEPDDQRLASIFTELIEYEKMIKAIDSDIAKCHQQADGSHFFKRTLEKGKIVLLENQRSRVMKGLPGLFRVAGWSICETGLDDILKSKQYSSIAKSYHTNQTRLKEINERNEALLAEHAKLNTFLSDLGAERQAKRKVSELKRVNSQLQVELDVVHEALGMQFRDNPPEQAPPEVKGSSEIDGYLERILSLESDNKEHEKQIERLEASLEIETKQKQVAEMRKKIKMAEEIIEKRQTEIKLLQDGIEETGREIKKLAKIRGPQNDINDITDINRGASPERAVSS